jgi:putative transposase
LLLRRPSRSKVHRCFRLIRALAVETHENWLDQHRYLNIEELREHKKLTMRQAA